MPINFIFECVKTGTKCLTFDTCIRKYMATNLTPDQTKEHKLWHQKYRDYHCENCHQGRTIFREEAGKKKILVDQRHKRHKSEALKNLEEIERNIRDKEEGESAAADTTATTTATEYVSEDTLAMPFDIQTVRNGKVETATAKNSKETTMKNLTDDNDTTKIKLDFSDHQDMLSQIVSRASNEFRTLGQQVLYMVHQQIVLELEKELEKELEP